MCCLWSARVPEGLCCNVAVGDATGGVGGGRGGGQELAFASSSSSQRFPVFPAPGPRNPPAERGPSVEVDPGAGYQDRVHRLGQCQENL